MELRIVFFLGLLGIAHGKIIDLSCEQIKVFVNGHNNRRLQLANGKVPGQPAASEMKYMIWDKELATKAAEWASSYRKFHNPDRTVGSGRFSTGENIYWYSTTDRNHKFNPDASLESWFTEYKSYDYGPIGNVSGTGHYTQMAWSDSTYVGCAISQNEKSGWFNYYVVCNYGPPGNYIGLTPYKKGRASKKLVCGGGNNCQRLFGDNC